MYLKARGTDNLRPNRGSKRVGFLPEMMCLPQFPYFFAGKGFDAHGTQILRDPGHLEGNGMTLLGG